MGWRWEQQPEPVMRTAEAPEFVSVTLRTAWGWTKGAAVCTVCAALVFEVGAHREWHKQFVHITDTTERCHSVVSEGVVRTTECPHEP